MDSTQYEDILQKDTVLTSQWIKFVCSGYMQK